jgi:hypothetical protein
LLFSALYLSLNLPDHKAGFGEEAPHGFTFLPNYMLDKLKGEFDLVVNTLSFSEFSEFQLRFYLEKIRDIIKDGILFEQNTDAHFACHVGGNVCSLASRPCLVGLAKIEEIRSGQPEAFLVNLSGRRR